MSESTLLVARICINTFCSGKFKLLYGISLNFEESKASPISFKFMDVPKGHFFQQIYKCMIMYSDERGCINNSNNKNYSWIAHQVMNISKKL